MKRAQESPLILCFATVAGISIILLRVWRIWAAGGLFFTFGLDYAIYGAAAEAVVQSGWSALYDVEANTRAFALWISDEPLTTRPTSIVASPYPAPFLLPFFATNLLGHGGGFVAWTILNVLMYAAIVRGLARGCERPGPLTSLAPFAFFPFLWTLYLGQLVIVMAFGLYRAMRAFDEGRERAAGCWLGLLLLKPQFGLLLALVLLAKRRWAALSGLGLVAAALAGSTLALVGVDGVRHFIDILRSFSGFRKVPSIVNPYDMINVRGVLVHLLPESWGEEQAMRLVTALSAALMLSLVPVWRGPWDPRSQRFPRQVLATVIVTLIASFHSHVHGATLLIIPMLAALRTRRDPDPLLCLYLLLIFVPTFSIAFDGKLEHCAWLLVVLMAGLYAEILVELAPDRSKTADRRTADEPHGAAAPHIRATATPPAACESLTP
jgi:alpha-1,2-mannosyltransferase